ncbi:SIR2 family protein [Pontibacter harenae]|uniref:SIR2 family protein n=1 Tax=Pontibacter harenae TaxID=2894083 RepID=UPI001E467BD9|nr:SIR2 family protein [Pontibacter harenae]MCC9165462.1 SIR2 family protein [Pontibacter harenae]
MKTVAIIGSGLNYIIADIINQYSKESSKSHLKQELEQAHRDLLALNNLWGELDNILNNPSSAFPSKNGEEIIQFYQTVFESKLFKNMISRDYNIEYSVSSHRNLLQDEIKRICYRFTEFENKGGYSNIKKLLPHIGDNFSNILRKNEVRKLHIYTLNYDGVLDALLTERRKVSQKQDYLFKDSFHYGEFNQWKLNNLPYLMGHLHGSYKYKRNTHSTTKLKKGIINENPVMIYNSPNLKKTLIKEDPVLKAYYNQLAMDLKTYQRLVVLGASFKTEPHLLELIRTAFNRPNTHLIVCSDKPREVASILESYYDFPIYVQSTEHIKTETDLIKLFDQLVSTKSTNFVATA